MKEQEQVRIARQTYGRVQLCREQGILIGGQSLAPDATRAYVEFYLAHAFPVTTCDKTGLHPQVVANSYPSMLHKVFDLSHLMKAYDPEKTPRDRILGAVVAVEFPSEQTLSSRNPDGSWKVQSSRAHAPGIRGVAVMHKQAEQVEDVLRLYREKQIRWTVSMEQEWTLASSGFAIAGRRGVEQWEESTPEDLRKLGWIYVPATEAPLELLGLLDDHEAKLNGDFREQDTVILFGGLNGQVHFKGVGLTPIGKEQEARVSQMLASGGLGFVAEPSGELLLDVGAPLRAGLLIVTGTPGPSAGE